MNGHSSHLHQIKGAKFLTQSNKTLNRVLHILVRGSVGH